MDKRTIEKYEKEAKEKNREGWYMAYIMDTNEEERTKVGGRGWCGRCHNRAHMCVCVGTAWSSRGG